MIIFIDVSLKEISKLNKKFPWKTPDNCPRCQSVKVWKHGFFQAYFDGFESQLTLRRFRCHDCGCVIRIRPANYFSRFQAPISFIRDSIANKCFNGKWLKGAGRTRQRHWFRALKRKVCAWFGESLKGSLPSAFDRLVTLGKIPVSRSL